MKYLAAALLVLAACAAPAPMPGHSAAGCLVGCPGATYVETSLNGQFCRCWAPNAFQYVFEYDKAEESSHHWRAGMRSAAACRSQGLGWEPNEDRSQIRCVKPTSAPAPKPNWLERASLPGDFAPPRWLQAPVRRIRKASA